LARFPSRSNIRRCAGEEDTSEDTSMKTYYTVTLAMLAGVGLGAAAVQGLHAQAKPPVSTSHRST
jgi:hypothetical protein